MNFFYKNALRVGISIRKNYRLGLLFAGIVWMFGLGMYLDSPPVYLACPNGA